jgi:hypothetical protein
VDELVFYSEDGISLEEYMADGLPITRKTPKYPSHCKECGLLKKTTDGNAYRCVKYNGTFNAETFDKKQIIDEDCTDVEWDAMSMVLSAAYSKAHEGLD